MKKKTSQSLECRYSKNPLPRIYLLTGFVATVVIGSMVYVFYIGRHMVVEHTPLIDAAMEIKLEATTAHLWLEEIISGDRNEIIEGVMKHMNDADWYARAMLEGGERSEGRFIPLKEPPLRRQIVGVREKLAEFKAITFKWWQARKAAGVGSELDEQYDLIFAEFIAQADLVETRLQQHVGRELRAFQIVQALLAVVCLSVTVVVGSTFGRFVRRRIRDEMVLQDANQQLIAGQQQLRTSEQELRREKDKAQQYLDVARIMLVAINREQRVELINKKGCEILG